MGEKTIKREQKEKSINQLITNRCIVSGVVSADVFVTVYTLIIINKIQVLVELSLTNPSVLHFP